MLDMFDDRDEIDAAMEAVYRAYLNGVNPPESVWEVVRAERTIEQKVDAVPEYVIVLRHREANQFFEATAIEPEEMHWFITNPFEVEPHQETVTVYKGKKD